MISFVPQVAQIIILKNEIKVHYFGEIGIPVAQDVFKAKYFEVIAKQVTYELFKLYDKNSKA